MEQPPIQHDHGIGKSKKEESHSEAVDFVLSHRDFLEQYARGQVAILPAPEGLDTFAFNLETNEIYVNGKFYESRGLSEEKTLFATLHEIEHFLEKKQILVEESGGEMLGEYLEKKKKSRAFGLLDNRVADTRQNRAIVTKNPTFGSLRNTLYKEDLASDRDFTAEPRHVQFSYALDLETQFPHEPCGVSPDVREELDKIKEMKSKTGVKLMDVMSNPEVSMSMRLHLQDKILVPAMEKLLQKDIEEEKKKREQKKDEDGDKGSSEKPQGQDEIDGESEKGGKENKEEETKDGEDVDPDEVFKDAYDRADKKSLNAVPIEEIEKALKEWKNKEIKNPLDRADKEYAEKLKVKKEDLQKYRKIIEELNGVKNKETGETIVEELRQLFERIIAGRRKPRQAPQYPVEEGEDLVDPAQLYASAKAGDFEPKVWESQEIRQEKGKRFGEIEISLVCDRSGSMQSEGGGVKLVEQRKAVVFLMEALKEFGLRADQEVNNLVEQLKVSSEIWSFQSSSEDSVPLKRMSKELGEKERIDVMVKISSAPGSTTDFVPLEKIRDTLSDDAKQKIKEGELKKIVIVLSDGKSDDSSRAKKVIENLRAVGVLVVDIGITEVNREDSRLAKKAEDLPAILAEVLKDTLSGV